MLILILKILAASVVKVWSRSESSRSVKVSFAMRFRYLALPPSNMYRIGMPLVRIIN